MEPDSFSNLEGFLADQQHAIETACRNPPLPLFEVPLDLVPQTVADVNFTSDVAGSPATADARERAFEIIDIALRRGDIQDPAAAYAICTTTAKAHTFYELSELLARELRTRERACPPEVPFPRTTGTRHVDGQPHQFRIMQYERYSIMRTTEFADFDLTLITRDLTHTTLAPRRVSDIEPYIRGRFERSPET